MDNGKNFQCPVPAYTCENTRKCDLLITSWADECKVQGLIPSEAKRWFLTTPSFVRILFFRAFSLILKSKTKILFCVHEEFLATKRYRHETWRRIIVARPIYIQWATTARSISEPTNKKLTNLVPYKLVLYKQKWLSFIWNIVDMHDLLHPVGWILSCISTLVFVHLLQDLPVIIIDCAFDVKEKF